MDIETLVENIRNTPGCVVRPPAGLSVVGENHVLPADLIRFYQLCGGLILFEQEYYAISIVPPSNVVLATPVVFAQATTEELSTIPTDDITWSWYIIAEDMAEVPDMRIAIDLSRERLGCCYDSSWDVYGGNSSIIATSFTELLNRLFACQGQQWYWGRGQFRNAYGYDL